MLSLRKIIYIVCVLSLCFYTTIYAQNINKDSLAVKSYSIIIADQSLRQFTMKQSNQNFLTSYRYLSQLSTNLFGENKTYLLQALTSLLSIPLTHEEGHRSILTSLGIGSISQPIFNTKAAAYVNGVRDETLMNLRSTNLPSYIRLHTAGLESDYTLLNRETELILFCQENKELLSIDHLFRKVSLIWYYSTSPFSALNVKLKEETNDLERDIVGHDIYGAVKHLHRPNDNEFYRYVNYSNLTNEEKSFLNRVALRALLNIVSPILIKPLNVLQKDNFRLSLGLGYSMSPFGDFIDENVWMRYKQKYNIHAYLRQYQNRKTWFPAGGVSLVDYQFSRKFNVTFSTHYWSQPKNLDFNTSKFDFGAAGDVLLRYSFLDNKQGSSLSFDLGLMAKSKGFLPEEVFLKEHLGLRVGITLKLNQKQNNK